MATHSPWPFPCPRRPPMNTRYATHSLAEISAAKELVAEATTPGELAIARDLLEQARDEAVLVCVCCERMPTDENSCGCEDGRCRFCFPPEDACDRSINCVCQACMDRFEDALVVEDEARAGY